MSDQDFLLPISTRSKRLLTIAEAAAYVGIAKKTLYNKISNGTFPIKPKRLGGKPLFDIQELDTMIDQL